MKYLSALLLSATLSVCVLFCASSCVPKRYVPQEGDLLFQTAAASDFAQAIVDATAQGAPIKFSHVAIVAMEDGKPYVIDASSRKGVARKEWDEFISSSPTVDGKPSIVVKRVNIDFPVREAVARAERHIGEEYDWSYLPDNGKMYCSELVYECYRREDGTPLFTARPMNFRDADGNMPAFWSELFEKLGEPIPEGVSGTNPNDMSAEPVLTEVYRFF